MSAPEAPLGPVHAPVVTLTMVGAGLRGQTNARHAVATGVARVVAVAEPDPVRRAATAAEFGVPDERVFAGWAQLVAAPRLADAAIVATQDRMHHDPAVRLAALGAEDRIGRLIRVQHLEPVGWWHHAHSFVRGNWRRADESGAADRCLDCPVEPSCPYSAKRLYLTALADTDRHFWPLGAVTAEATEAAVPAALRTGPYGRCVYAADNDVVDHQVVTMEFPDSATCAFTMTAFTPMEHRRTRLFGSHGYLDGDGTTVRHVDFRTGAERVFDARAEGGPSAADGHGGGDRALAEAFVAAVAAGDPAPLSSGGDESLATHRVVWAAEQARVRGQVVRLAPDGTVTA